MMRSNYNHRARLVLEEPQAIYYAGQVLTGYIELEIQNPIQFSAINVTFHGSAHVRWSEIETAEYNGMQEMRKVEYNGGQDCLHYTQCLYGRVLPGRGDGIVDIQSIPPGEREIPFKFTLPKDIPSSFKSKRGQVTYNVTAYVEYLNHEMGRDELYHEFEVVAPMILLENDIVRPVEMHFEEIYSCCCSSSPMSVDIKCPVSGYCPGQAIPINIKVKNESSVEVKKIVFQLLKKELYRSLEPPSEYTTPDEVLATVKTGAILSNSDKGFTCHLPIPPMIAPNMDNCDVIDIGFFLRAVIKMTDCNDDLEDEVLLFIGLKPIPGTPGSENYVHPLARNLPNGAPVSDAPLRANIEQVARPTSYPGQNVTPYPAENVNSRPVQPFNSSYPGQNTPYPIASPRSAPNATSQPISSYPGQNLPPYPTRPNTSGPAPYPPKPVGFDALPHPVPTGYPNPTPPMPSSRSPYPLANSPPYPTSPNTSGPAPYPPKTVGFDALPHPVPTGYPNPTPPMPSSRSPYPLANSPPYPTSPNTSGPAPYPPKTVGFDALPHPVPTGYPNPTPPMPSSRSPYPLANSPPYPTSPNTSGPAPYPPKTVGFDALPHPVPTGYPNPTPPMPSSRSPYPLANSPPYPTSPNTSGPAPYPPKTVGFDALPHPVPTGYPNPTPPMPSSRSPYPLANSPPYPTSPNTSGPAPYPPKTVGFDALPHPVPTGYPNPTPPMPSSRSPYPLANSPPYPTSPNTSGPAPYPPKTVGFDALPHPVPTGYPNPTPPMSSSRSPYPPANSPYPPANSSHPSANSPYPPENSTHPPEKSPYPPANSSHPSANSPYPPENPSHPSANSPYPPENPSHPSANSPYPPENPSHPSANSPYPPANSPHPPINSPYPSSTPPYTKKESMSMTPLRTQTLGFILPSGSPHPSAKNDDQNSPYTPLMQNHPSPSAPPPSS